MNCIAIRDNQQRVNGHIRYFERGEVFDFQKLPKDCWVSTEDVPRNTKGQISYEVMDEGWMLSLNGDVRDLTRFIKRTYPKSVPPKNASWEALVRYLFLQKSIYSEKVDNTGGSKPLEVDDSLVITVQDGESDTDITEGAETGNEEIDDLNAFLKDN